MTEKESSSVAAANSSYSEESKKKRSEAEQPQLVPAPSPTSSQQQEKNDNKTSEESPPLIDIDSLASVKSLKDPKLIKGRRRHDSPSDGPATMYSTPIKQKSSSSSPLTPETHKITITTISPAPSSANSVISDLSIQKAYRQHKQTTPKSSGGALHDILEDVQFCGMYFCGEFLAINNNDDSPDDSPDDDPIEDNENIVNITTEQVVTISKEERIKEMDDTLLGKMIQCGDIGDSCGTSGDYILFRPDEDRNDALESSESELK